MKKVLTIVLFVFAVQNLSGQTAADSISVTWTKYLITNDKDQILLVYDKSYGAWELPGCGYEGPITFKNLMDTLAGFYGFNYDSYKLGGLFSYFKPGRYRATVKPYYKVHFTGYKNAKSFKDTSRLKWVDIEMAKKEIPYPTMVLILDQLIRYPDSVWGGAFEEYNYNPPASTRWKIIEPFYKLN